MQSKLVGYIRKSKTGKNMLISLDRQCVLDCETYTTADGQEFIRLNIPTDRICQVLANTRPVTSVMQSDEAE